MTRNKRFLLSQTRKFFASDFDIIGIPHKLKNMTLFQVVRAFLLLTFWSFTFISDLLLIFFVLIMALSFFYINYAYPILLLLGIGLLVYEVFRARPKKTTAVSFFSFLKRLVFTISGVYVVLRLLMMYFFPELWSSFHTVQLHGTGGAFLIMAPYIIFPLLRGILYIFYDVLSANKNIKLKLYKHVYLISLYGIGAIYVIGYLYLVGPVLSNDLEYQAVISTKDLGLFFEYIMISIGFLTPLIKFRVNEK